MKTFDETLLEELIADDDARPAPKRGRPPSCDLSGMSPKQLLRHQADLTAARRARKIGEINSGTLPFDLATTRDALADAAIMLLASDLPGSDAVMAYLTKVFHRRPGAPLTIKARARAGQLPPKLLRFAKTVP